MAKLPWSLGELIAPLTVSEFREHYWGRRAYATKIPAGATSWLRSELDDFDPVRLTRRYRGQIAIWFKTLDAGQRVVAAANTDDALALYDAGKTIFLHNGAATPAIVRWERQLADEAAHPATPLTASLFLSRLSAATAMHFDMLENITIQLSGHKRWRLAPNPHVQHPISNWALHQAVAPGLERMLESQLPAEMPETAESFDLEEGTLLYTPRGYFHETAAAQDSVSLFLGMPPATWLDLMLDGMREHLERLPHWRENVLGGSSPERVQAARQRLDELRAGLADDLSGLDTELLLPQLTAPLDDARTLRRNPLAVVQVTGGRITVSMSLGKVGRRNELAVPPELMPFVEWLLAHQTFSVAEALATQPSLSRATALEVLGGFQSVGLFT
jgi:50S ribosomal protein L16 3-hydroxylase